jgi:hypothetical protein
MKNASDKVCSKISLEGSLWREGRCFVVDELLEELQVLLC